MLDFGLARHVLENSSLLLTREGAVIFFFQAEDGIRDLTVTGVQTLCSSDLDNPRLDRVENCDTAVAAPVCSLIDRRCTIFCRRLQGLPELRIARLNERGVDDEDRKR